MSLRIPVGPDDHRRGNPHAPVVLVEYGDYECPVCGGAYPLVKDLLARFGDGLCFVFRNFPLSEVHPQALPAAITAEYAARHGRFWQAHDALFENQDALGESLYAELADALRLPLAGLRDALAGGGVEAERVEADFEGGVRSGVNGTPCFFVNGRRFDPRAGYEELAGVIEALLAGQGG